MANTFLNAEAFATKVAEDLSAACSRPFTVQACTKNKTKLVGIVSHIDGDSDIAPVIYVDDYFRDYTNGDHTYEEIIAQIRKTYETATSKLPDSADFAEMIYDWNKVKSLVLPVLYGTSDNDDLLSKIVCRPIEGTDLMVGYNLEFDLDFPNGNVGSVKVLPRFVEQWGCSMEELHEAAIENQRSKGFSLCNMENVILSITAGESPFKGAQVFHLPERPDVSSDFKPAMYTLSTPSCYYGASLLCDPQIVEMISDLFGKDLLIIPSSVHEVIILPDSAERADEIRQMVYEVNRTQVAPEEVLSDSVYGVADGKIRVL